MIEADTILQNRYQLKQKLGDNAARQTWLAIDSVPPDNPQVVVKLLAFGGQIQWENIKLFEREAQILKQLNHPHIPKYRDYFCIDDRSLWFGLVEDYIPGSSLKELLNQRQRLTEKQATKIAINILNILDYLHQLNPPVLHRDIKPSNLIMGEDNQVYLVDFGSVQDSAAKEGGTFTIVGTYGYTPIEQFGGRAVPASDLYALGATLIHLLTGIAPADLPQKDFRIHFSDKVSISSGFLHWLEQLVEPSLENRLGSVNQALEALANPSLGNQIKLRQQSFYLGAKAQSPDYTQVKLNKSSSHLEIEIKASEEIKHQFHTNLAVCSIVGVIFTSLLGFYILPVLIIALIVFTPAITNAISYYFGTTKIDFNPESLEIVRQLSEITYLKHKEYTAHIQDVYVTYNGGEKGITMAFGPYLNPFVRHSFGRTLSKHFVRRSFGGNLSDAELIWLAQEIRDWLQLQKQREARH
ncbi:MAG: serine/threonine protein kinase [Tatlockia sp.]|nr:serine/threonine protein kinase [Tatlockia sp.]